MPRLENREVWALRVEILSSTADSFSRSINECNRDISPFVFLCCTTNAPLGYCPDGRLSKLLPVWVNPCGRSHQE